MPSYYPSQGSYAPQVQPGVVYTSSSHHGHGHHHHHQPTVYASNDPYYGQPTVVAPPMVASTSAPVVMQPSGYGGQQYYGRMPVGERLRRFFGLAPRSNFRYKSNRTSWGFLGYSRRPRYVDARTGGEVDRHGRPIYRV